MAGSVEAPYGMVQVGILGQGYNTSGQTMYPLGSNNTNAIFRVSPYILLAVLRRLSQPPQRLRFRQPTLP